MNRHFSILLIVMLSFLMISTVTYFYGKSVEKIEESCCEKEISQKVDTKGCCKKGNSHDDTDGCNGQCGNSSCQCPSNTVNFTVPFFAQLLQLKVNFIQPNFYYPETLYSSGFRSIWIPPKIS